MIRVVVDTNVIISALIFGGKPAKILHLANEGAFDLLISPFILNEMFKVLTKQFGWAEGSAEKAVKAIKEIANFIEPTERLSIIKGKESDNRILECAVFGKADFIVTGDTKHILPLKEYQGIRILKPAEFLEQNL